MRYDNKTHFIICLYGISPSPSSWQWIWMLLPPDAFYRSGVASASWWWALGTIREKPTAGVPNLLTAGKLQLASDTNAGGNALSLAHCIFAGDNCTYCRRIATFARGNTLPLANVAMRR
jgi:hypothetical protein